MTSRERFHLTMDYSKPDRLLYFEEGLRKDVLRIWRKQGLSSDLSELNCFKTDRFEHILPEIDPLPSYKNWPSATAQLFDLEKRLNENDPGRLPRGWIKTCHKWDKNDTVVFLRVHRGFFQALGVYDWGRFNELMSLLIEDPVFVNDYMELYTEFIIRLSLNIVKKVRIDGIIFSEPIGGTEGPLISPAMYEEFVLRFYQKIIDTLQKSGIRIFIYRTYANTRILLPLILKYGFNCLWACETNAEAMNYLSIRKELGRDLRLIGGIDLDTLRKNKDAIRYEIDRIIPELVADGGYIPLADGRVRSDVSLDNYIFYRKYLESTIERLN